MLNNSARAENCYDLVTKDAEFQACQTRKDESRLGKYFCFITHSVGIQYPLKADGDFDQEVSPFTGKIKLKNEKFFMELHRGPGRPSFCNTRKTEDNYCADRSAPFLFTSKSDDTPHEAYGYNTFVFRNYGDVFKLYGNLKFTTFTSLENSYVSQGQCEKIN